MSTENNTNIIPQDEDNSRRLEGEKLLEAIRKQVEYYMSRQNITNDPFLVSHMSKDMFVPVEIIAGFKMMKTLTEEPSLIVEAVRSSTQVTLDDTSTKIRPNFTVSRNTVILRNIASSTKEEQVRQIFDKDNQPESLKSDIGDTWFVMFETDDKALLALDFIRGKLFNGQPIQARIKSENLLKSSYPANQPYANFSRPQYPQENRIRNNTQYRGNGSGVAPRGGASGPKRGGAGGPRNERNPRNAARDYFNPKAKNVSAKPQNTPFVQNVAAPVVVHNNGKSTQQQKPTQDSSVAHPTSSQSQQAPPARGAKQNQVPTAVTTTTYQKSTPNRAPNSTSPSSPPITASQAPIKKSTRKQKSALPIPTIDNAKNFPPLPSMPVAERSKNGYGDDEYIRYDKQVVADIYSAIVKDLAKPADLLANCTIVRDTPHSEMVLMTLPEGSTVVEGGHQESVKESTMISFAEAVVTARDIKTPEISSEHLLPHRMRRNSNVKASDMIGRKRGDSFSRSRSNSAAAHVSSPSSALIRPEPHRPEVHRPEPKKFDDKQQKFDDKQQKPQQPKKPVATKENKLEIKAEKKVLDATPATKTAEVKHTSPTFSYASVLQQKE